MARMPTFALRHPCQEESAEGKRNARHPEAHGRQCSAEVAMLMERFRQEAMRSSPDAPLPKPIGRIENLVRLYGSRFGFMERWPRRW